MTFRRSPKSASSRRNFRSTIPAGCRASCSICAATSSRTRGCAGPSTTPIDFEEMNKQLFYGQYKRINSYFDGTELASSGLPEGQELQILETVRDKVPAGSLHHALHQSGRRQSGSRARQFAGEHEASEGGRLRDPRPQARGCGGQAGHRRDSGSGSVRGADRAVLQAVAGAHRRHDLDPHRRRCAVSEPAAQLRFRYHHRPVGRIAVARQRAAGILGIAGRGSCPARGIPSASRIRPSMR